MARSSSVSSAKSFWSSRAFFLALKRKHRLKGPQCPTPRLVQNAGKNQRHSSQSWVLANALYMVYCMFVLCSTQSASLAHPSSLSSPPPARSAETSPRRDSRVSSKGSTVTSWKMALSGERSSPSCDTRCPGGFTWAS